MPIPGTADLSHHLGLLRRGDLHYRCSWHRNSSLIVATVSQLLTYQRVRLCANLLWFDLGRVGGDREHISQPAPPPADSQSYHKQGNRTTHDTPEPPGCPC